MADPKISIIIPVYNVEKYLERCVKSLQEQTLKEIEIILVDDASTDASPQLCDRLAAEDDRITVIHKVNEGAGLARNAALGLVKGEYIGFVDSDDFVEPDMFQTLYEKAQQYDSDLVLSGVVFVDGSMFSQAGDREMKSYFDCDTQFETEEEIKKLRMGIIGATPQDADDSKYGMSIWKNLFRTEVIRKNGLSFLSEREFLSEDALFLVDYIACIKRATGISGAFYNYCRNGDSISKGYKKERFEKSLVFVDAVKERFEKDIKSEEYRIYIDRFWQAICRVICSQEVMHAEEKGVKYAELRKRLKRVCTHSLTVNALKAYPIGTLPIQQRVFAYAMKYRLYFIMKLLVDLRSKWVK